MFFRHPRNQRILTVISWILIWTAILIALRLIGWSIGEACEGFVCPFI